MANLKYVTYDDRDFTNLKYNGASWVTNGSWNAISVGRAGTLSTAWDVGASMTFTFPQPADAFYYYGIPQCCGGNYSICVDCFPEAPQFKTIQVDAVNRTDDGQNPPVVLFSYFFKNFGIHEIVLINNNDTRFNQSTITIDQFVLQVEDPDVVSSTNPSLPSSMSQTPSISSSAAAVVIPTPTTEVPVGVIVGATVGGLVVVSIIVALLLWRRKRRRRADETEPEVPQPFFISSATASTSYAPRKNLRSTVISPSTPTPNISSGSTSARPPRRRETDAGPVQADHDEEEDDTATLPPEYDQVFRRAQSQNRLPLTSRTLPPLPPLPTPQKD